MCQIIQAALKPFMLKVILRGGSDNVDFRGFMIQGRMKADDSVVGNFVVGSKYQTQCDKGVRSMRKPSAFKLSVICAHSPLPLTQIIMRKLQWFSFGLHLP